MNELKNKYPQFEFSGEIYTIKDRTYIRAEYKDEALAEATGDYYYCFEDGNFLLTDDFNDLMSD